MQRILIAVFGLIATGALLALGAGDRPSATTGPAAARQEFPRRVKVLWLGDNGHHVPLERCRQAFSTLAERGIDLTYTEALNDLNPQTLSGYDCLLLYANITQIAPDQEKALLDYVESGHGFVPVHCGSYCFLNSPKITALTGGRFKSHSTGVFSETIVQPDHPIEQGLKPIESWDETYVHEMHNEQGRTVLGTRVQDGRAEPYTWVRTQGKGRVFYTAWGHDERTWGNANFQQLLVRGIRWAAGDWALEERTTPSEPDMESAGPIPNYLPGKKWGTEGEPIHRMQQPLTPLESMKHMVLPPGFEAKLYAADPDIYKPICIAFDERGRLWIAETVDYPNSMQATGEGHDRIVICEDTTGSGKADKFTVFADHLSIPTSMCFANGGVVVAQAPDMLFLKSSRGDDHADVRKVLFSGFGTHDTHAGPSNLRWGFDNWIYGSIGYSGFKGNIGGQDQSFGQGVFRFKPDGSMIEFLGSDTNNTWGLGFSEQGDIFSSTANGAPSFYFHIPNRYYEQVKGWTVKRLEPIMDTPAIFPITDKVRQMDNHGKYTAGAGDALYTARSFPQKYWDRFQFVAEPTAHLLGQFVVQAQGSDFVTRNDFNFLASDDEWTAPIAAEVGPDGALWMTDWYNYIVQHNPIPKGFEPGKGGAYVTPVRDKTHGRIYRLVYTEGKPSKTYDLSKAAPAQLVEALKSDNLLWRMHAQRLLVELRDKSVAPALLTLVRDPSMDAIGLNAAAVHALWTLHGLGVPGDGAGSAQDADAVKVIITALTHRSAPVRRAAVEVLPRTTASADAILSARLLEDSDPQVRKTTLLALSEMPASDAAGAAVFSILSRRENAGDRWISDAAIIAGAKHDAGFLRAVFAAHPAAPGATAGSNEAANAADAVNLLPNPSFEESANGRPRGWQVRHYSGEAVQDVAASGHTGEHSIRLHSDTGADTSWHADVPVQPHTDYRLSCWIKAEGVKPVGNGLGALLNVHGTDIKTRVITGTHDWEKVQVDFSSGELSQVSINCLLGGWGHATGTAWYDDIELTPHQSTRLAAGPEGRVIQAIVNQYAQRGPADSVVATISATRKADPALASTVLEALSLGWPRAGAPKLSDADTAELRATMTDLRPDARDRLLALAERWGRRDLFTAQLAAATKDLRTSVADATLAPVKRARGGATSVGIDEQSETLDLILDQINPKAAPEVQLAMMGALSESRNPALGGLLLARWTKLTPSSQAAALNVLVHRAPWASALLDAVKAGTVHSKDLLPQQWQALSSYPDPAIADRAKSLQNAQAPISSDRKALVEKGMPLLQRKGDAALGRKVFEHNCLVCHTIEGQGGKVGPDLTGIGARPRVDNLIQILDPNRSVEGTFRLWTARTDEDVITGRLYSESKTSVEIIDAAGMVHSLQRDQIKSLKSSDKGVMPEGFELLPPDDIVNVLEYLATSTVKH